MRRRSSWAISLGLTALIASWLFGSKPAAVMGIGFIVAGVSARLWARTVRRSVELERRVLPGERVEGADLVIEVRGRRRAALVRGSVTLHQRLGPFVQESRMPGGRSLLTFSGLTRGRHRLDPLLATLSDPLGLERVEQRLESPVDILVRPRIPELMSVFTSHGAREIGAIRSAFRQPTGFEIHAVRDYVPGESVRAVHWPSTARRGSLMVKELDDAPREDITIVLDLDANGVAGPPGGSSFDAAVRAAGAIALAHVVRGRRVAIVDTAPSPTVLHIRTRGHDWETALDALASVEPVAGATVAQALRTAASPATRARELVVVTGLPGPAVEALLELGRAGRSVSIVSIAAETFVGRPRRPADPALLRAAARGIPIAVVTADTSIEAALAAQPLGAVGG